MNLARLLKDKKIVYLHASLKGWMIVRLYFSNGSHRDIQLDKQWPLATVYDYICLLVGEAVDL